MNQPWMYVVLIGLVIIVFAKIKPMQQTGRTEQPGVSQEVENAMDHFAIELEEQNKAIIQLFTDTKKEYELHTAKLSSRVELLEKHNQQLQTELSRVGFMTEQMQKNYSTPSTSTAGDIVRPEPLTLSAGTGEHQASDLSKVADHASAGEEPLVLTMNIKQRYADLFAMYDQGKSMEAIAKKLGMNKGEISLILQLAKQEEQTNGQ